METTIIIRTILLWIAVIVAHELGHYFAAVIKKADAKFEIRWWGVALVIKDREYLTPVDLGFITVSGVWLGLVVLQAVGLGNTISLFLYILMCWIDINIIASTIKLMAQKKGIKTFKWIQTDAAIEYLEPDYIIKDRVTDEKQSSQYSKSRKRDFEERQGE